MNKTVIIETMIITFIIGVMSLIGYRMGAADKYTASEVNQLLAEEAYEMGAAHAPDNARNYNQGFRAGAMDHLSILVECDGVTDPAVVAAYNSMMEIMVRLGELEEDGGMYCGE